MNAPSQPTISKLRGSILREVSRSFYLSIRLLPLQLRDPIALAYLLARATDTIADTAEFDAVLRLERLRDLAALIQRADLPPVNADAFQSFASLQKDDAERALIERLPACLLWLQALAEDDRREIRDVLAKINEGQTLDLQRFQNAAQITALATAAELDRYTYLVAGCVGEFWTRVCFLHLPHFSAASREQMLEWGVSYGKGLQLVNILRDCGADIRAGRCYLPTEELNSLGVEPADLAGDPARAEPVLRAWRERAESGIAAGVEYACAIESRRVRLATALPALIGARTLALLRDAGTQVFQRRVKMERAEVRGILFALTARMASRSTIRALFARLRL
ncbi:MAG TPA: phytoene/squalene synthase family protein [Chthoniobacterales bacterium]|nr:phytoene/squalene synthase family protein [Chthoniobacterales bacterium]